ncbi:MAG: hypothetical protein HY941_10175 [Gammaproteobacteria bacterium]|nr:hypothetical protein [Gammaproteobacteria bacterium]
MYNAIVRFGALCLLLGAVTVQATPRSGGGDTAARQAQAMIQKMAAENNALQKQNGELTAKLAELETQIKSLEAEGKRRGGELDQAQRSNEDLRARVERDSERYKELSARHGQTTDTLRDAKADIQLLHGAVQERDHWIADCRDKNEAMYKTNNELLAAYRDKSAWDALKQREPLTGIALVEVENAVQEYQFRLEDLRTVQFESTADEHATP